MHKFYPHYELLWTDTNYGNMLLIWERLFGTFLYDNPDDIVYGLNLLNNEKSDDLTCQLGLPFNKEIQYKN